MTVLSSTRAREAQEDLRDSDSGSAKQTETSTEMLSTVEKKVHINEWCACRHRI